MKFYNPNFKLLCGIISNIFYVGYIWMDFKKIVLIFGVVVLFLGVFMMSDSQDKSSASLNSQKPIVSVSTFSIYDITKHIAGDSVELVNILPFGVSAHSFEPTPKLMGKIERSALVIFSGGGLEPWTDGFNFKHSALNISKYVKLREMVKKSSHKMEHHEDDGHHHNSKTDPHYWLDIANMITATNVITEKLIEISPQNKSLYTKNQQDYVEMLEKLKKDFDKNLKECKHDTLVTNHNAFSYVAKKYNFKTAALSGLSPQAMPSAKTIASLMQKIEKEDIRTIFFESFANEKVIRTIAQDTHINVDVLHPLGNITADQASQNLTYENIMRENLQKISKALECN